MLASLCRTRIRQGFKKSYKDAKVYVDNIDAEDLLFCG